MIRKNTKFVAALSILLLVFPLITKADFSDVNDKNEAYNAISNLSKTGVIQGYKDGTFKPDSQVTRAELLKMAFSDVGFKPDSKPVVTGFWDVAKNKWYSPYVKKALELNSISIDPKSPRFYPEKPVTKIDAVKMILPIEGIPAPYITWSTASFASTQETLTLNPSTTQETTDLSNVTQESDTQETTQIYDDIPNDSPYYYLVSAAVKANLFSDTQNFNPTKLLTRAEAAELIYNASLYRQNANGGLQIQSLPYDPSSGTPDLVGNSEYQVLVDVWQKITQKYFDQNSVDRQKMLYGAIDGMVKSLGDQYSVFESPDKADQLQQILDGKFTGIGAVLDTKNGSLIINSTIKGSPAEKAGLLPNDQILKVDDKDVTSENAEDVITQIRGAEGTSVKVTISRNGATMDFNIVRAKIDYTEPTQTPEISVALPSDIAYLAIKQFTPTTADEFATLLQKALAQNPKGLILDLRDNPGGYLNTAYKVLGHFIKAGNAILNLKTSDGVVTSIPSDGLGEVGNLPIVVLINKNSASASEVVAGALQDYKLATLVGDQSFGKGTVQEVTDYTDGSILKLSIAYWLTPLQRSINKVGLTPDVPISLTDIDINSNTDTQLLKAIQIIQSK